MIYTGDFFSHGISTYSWGKLFKRDILVPIQKNFIDPVQYYEQKKRLNQ